jgi:hypothetical protein
MGRGPLSIPVIRICFEILFLQKGTYRHKPLNMSRGVSGGGSGATIPSSKMNIVNGKQDLFALKNKFKIIKMK